MNEDWTTRYATLLAGLPARVAGAPLILCGMGVCIDARVSLHDLAVALNAPSAEAATFARVLQDRAARGVGGELAYDWPAGPAWIAAHCRVERAMGGTGPHAAWVLTAAGAPALLALEDRSAAMLKQMPADILLAEGDALVPARAVVPRGEARPEVFIFEYTAGHPIGDVVASRSSRIIVRFADLGLEHDAAFDAAARGRAGQAGAGLVSGFSAVPAAEMVGECARVFGLVRDWRAAGLETVHLELAGYDPPDGVHEVLAAGRGLVTSVGMSHSEFRALRHEGTDLGQALALFADDLAVDRVCIHADHWAAAVTRRDPAVGGGGVADGLPPGRRARRRGPARAPRGSAAGQHVRGTAVPGPPKLRPVALRGVPVALSRAAGHDAWARRHVYGRVSAGARARNGVVERVPTSTRSPMTATGLRPSGSGGFVMWPIIDLACRAAQRDGAGQAHRLGRGMRVGHAADEPRPGGLRHLLDRLAHGREAGGDEAHPLGLVEGSRWRGPSGWRGGARPLPRRRSASSHGRA